MFSRSNDEWLMDICGLFIQGLIIPLIPFFALPILKIFLPFLAGKYEIHTGFQFIFSFVGIDYLYYWNHRYFHSKKFWYVHRLHHSSRHLDIISTSRNNFLSSFLFIYLWFQTAAMFLFKDSSGFLLGLTLTFSLDLWRHSGHKTNNFIRSLFSWILILPEEHLLHHSIGGRNKNFGANICWWDKIHGTYSDQMIKNKDLDNRSYRNIIRELFFPGRA